MLCHINYNTLQTIGLKPAMKIRRTYGSIEIWNVKCDSMTVYRSEKGDIAIKMTNGQYNRLCLLRDICDLNELDYGGICTKIVENIVSVH